MENEIWKDIDGFENIYKISNYGRVKSYKKNPNGVILSAVNKKGGYLTVRLGKKSYRIHILVAEYFLCKPKEKCDVHHKDHDNQKMLSN